MSVVAKPKMAAIRRLPHVIIFPFPFHGHIIPAFAFAKSLALKGFFVSFLSPNHRLSRMHEALARGAHPHIRLLGLPDNVPADQSGIDEGVNSISWAAGITEALVDAFDGFLESAMAESSNADDAPGAPVGIISDNLLSWTQDAANRWRIPRYVLYPSPAALMSVLFCLPPLLSKGLMPLRSRLAPKGSDNEGEGEVEVITVPGLPPLRTTDIHSALLNTTATFGRDFYIRHSLRLHEAAGVLINTFHELESSAIAALESEAQNPNLVPILAIGPLLPAPYFDEKPLEVFKKEGEARGDRHECLQWLDDQNLSSVLFISFGTLIVPTVLQMHEYALGLEASGQPFLWVLRPPPSIPGSPPLLPAALLPDGFLQRTEKQGFVISSWAPQLEILAHPAVGGFFTHCGWNSILESILMGIPMLAIPEFADQRMNCRMLVDQWKIGLEVRKGVNGVAGRAEVEKKVRVLMQDLEGKNLRSCAKDLSKLARAAAAVNGSSFKNLELLIQGLVRSH